MNENRLKELTRRARRHRLDWVLVQDPANVRALTDIVCDNAVVAIEPPTGRIVFHTDFRYVPMVRRMAPTLALRDIRKLAFAGRRIGYESCISHARFLALNKTRPRATFVDILPELQALRQVKSDDELERLKAAEKLNCAIWRETSSLFRPGMTEREMARMIRLQMVARGEGEAFETIVCIGPNAAECHHVPDDTVWDGRSPVLVDMGVKLNGMCSDLTRNLVPRRASLAYRRAFEVVAQANRAAIAAARPGISAKALDAVARRLIAKAGFGRCFGHALGHGVGLEIHEAPTVSSRSDTILRPGMVITIEPGIYLEGHFGIRIEDMVQITETGAVLISEP